MHSVQRGEEGFIAQTHEEEHGPAGVVHVHDGVVAQINELVAGAPLQEGGVQVYPVSGNVDAHAQLEPEHVLGVEVAERYEQTHGAAPVSQLIEYCAELGALVQQSCGVSVKRVQQAGHAVASHRNGPVRWHEVERDHRQDDSSVAD